MKTKEQFTPFSATEFKIIADTEEKERNSFKKNISERVAAGQFAYLEALEEEYRTNEFRFANGGWKLTLFYQALGGDKTNRRNTIDQLTKMASSHPKSAMPSLGLGVAYYLYAYDARGSDVADKVPEEKWPLVNERISTSFKWLAQARKIAPKHPALDNIVLRTSLLSDVDRSTYEQIFESSVKCAPGNPSPYLTKAYYLLPRWYGKPGESESFVRNISKKSDVPGAKEIFARTAFFFRDMGMFYDEFSNDPTAWQELKESFLEWERNYPDSIEVKSAFCMICCVLMDYEEGRKQMKLLEGNVDLNVWGDQDHYIHAVTWLNLDDATIEQQRKEETGHPFMKR